LTNCADTRNSSISLSNRCDTLESVLALPVEVCNERYSALMKHTRKSYFLLAPVLLASIVFAQTRDERAANHTSGSDEISAARGQYTQTAGISPDSNPDTKDDKTLAQFRRHGSGMPFPPQGGYPRGSYQTPWMDHGDAGHILIGAAIGFGVGAALGAHQSAQNGTPVGGGIIIGGALLGLIGGCVGEAVGSFHGVHYWSAPRRRVSRPSWPEDDEESNLGSHSKAKEDHSEASAKPASSGQVRWPSKQGNDGAGMVTGGDHPGSEPSNGVVYSVYSVR
jgi:hypothetical protein